MTIHVEAKLAPGCPWLPAILTTERAESSYGQPVLVIEGEGSARGSAEVYAIRPLWIAADRAEEREILTAAKHAGYCVLFKVSREPVDPENPSEKESPMTTTPATSETEAALDRLHNIAQDVDAHNLVEFYEGAQPSDRPFMELCEASIDLDRSDLPASAVAHLRDIAGRLAALADAIEQDDQEAPHTATHTAYRIMATADDGGAVYPHPLPIGEYPTEESARLGLGRIVAEHDGVNGPGCYWIETPDGRRIFAGV